MNQGRPCKEVRSAEVYQFKNGIGSSDAETGYLLKGRCVGNWDKIDCMKCTINFLAFCQGLKTTKNSVFYDVSYGGNAITQEICDTYSAVNIPIEAWRVNSASAVLGLNKYVSGITSDNLIEGKVLYDSAKSA